MDGEKIESMLSQLIKMVGTLQSEFRDMKQDMDVMKQEINVMKQEINEIKLNQQKMEERLNELEEISSKRHREIINRFTLQEKDLDFIWEKAVRNEREIEILKRKSS